MKKGRTVVHGTIVVSIEKLYVFVIMSIEL